MTQTIILGAGMVGVATALALQARGRDVMLLDRTAPGRETSFGNAGIIQAEAAEPYAMPRDPATLLAFAMGRSNDVRYDPRTLVRLAPSLWRYFRASAPARHRALSAAYGPLTARACSDHAPLIRAAGAEDLIHRVGYLQLYRAPRALEAAAADLARLQQTYGVAGQMLDGAALALMEPALKPGLPGALHWLDPWSCTDPGALVSAYADLLVARGGTSRRAAVTAIAPKAAGWRIETEAGGEECADLVIALGPWAPELLRPLGYRIAMIRKRGYHRHFHMSRPPERAMFDAANGVVLAPMRAGLRLTTGAELTATDAPVKLGQLHRGSAAAADLFDTDLTPTGDIWHGHRPCLPDMLPLVGAAPRHRGLWFNFGHGHQGFTLGPTTAALLADAMEGQGSDILAALSPKGRVS